MPPVSPIVSGATARLGLGSCLCRLGLARGLLGTIAVPRRLVDVVGRIRPIRNRFPLLASEPPSLSANGLSSILLSSSLLSSGLSTRSTRLLGQRLSLLLSYRNLSHLARRFDLSLRRLIRGWRGGGLLAP